MSTTDARIKYDAGSSTLGFAAVLVVAVILFVICAMIVMPFVPDDSYVTFRYAERLAEGNGLAFNSGDAPVEGYSNFLWVVIAAVAHKNGMNLPTAMPWIGVLFGVLNVLLLAAIFYRSGFDWKQSVVPLLVFASAGPLVTYAGSGMETMLYSLLLLFSLMCFDGVATRGSIFWYAALGVAGVLAALCRPEGILVFPALVLMLALVRGGSTGGAVYSVPRRVGLWISIIVFLAGVITYTVWRVGYFGAFVPSSFSARFGVDGSLARVWLDNFLAYFYLNGNDFMPSGPYYLALFIAAMIGLSVTRSDINRRRTEMAALYLAAAYAILYWNFMDPLPGMRYHAPLIGLLIIPAAHVQAGVVETLKRKSNRTLWIKFSAGALAVLLIGFSWIASIKMGTARVEEGNRECSAAVGKWLKDAMEPDTRLAISEMGGVSYYSGFETLDIALRPVTNKRATDGAESDKWFFEWSPRIVIFSFEGMFRANPDPKYRRLIESKPFEDEYRLFAVLRHDWHKDRSYWIYIPRDLPPFDEAHLKNIPMGIGSVGRINK